MLLTKKDREMITHGFKSPHLGQIFTTAVESDGNVKKNFFMFLKKLYYILSVFILNSEELVISI